MKKKNTSDCLFLRWLHAFLAEVRDFFKDLPWGMKMLGKALLKKIVWFFGEVVDFFIDLPIGLKGLWGLFLEKATIFRSKVKKLFIEMPTGIRNAVLYRKSKNREKRKTQKAQKAENKALEKLYKKEQDNLRHAVGEQKSEKRQKILFNSVVTVLSIVLFLQVLLFAAVGIWVGSQKLSNRPGSVELVVASAKLGSSNYNKVSTTISPTDAHPNGGEETYIDFSFIAEQFSLRTFHDGKAVRYTMQDGKMLVVTPGSNHLMLDGEPLMLSGAAYEVNGRIYLPLEILTEYAGNITVSYDPSANKITVLRNKDEEKSGYTQLIFKELTFSASGIKPAPNPELIEKNVKTKGPEYEKKVFVRICSSFACGDFAVLQSKCYRNKTAHTL